jgi:predicted nucleotidyltransferase
LAQFIEQLKRDKKVLIAILNKHHAANVRVFGSVARGDERKDSDVDLLVDFQPGTTLFDQVALENELSDMLGRKVDVVSSRALNRHLRPSVLREAVEL